MPTIRSRTSPLRLHPFVLAVAFLSTYYVALLGPILPAIAEPLGGNAFAIGLLFSCYAFAQFLTAPALGAIGDRFGRRRVLLVGMCGAILGFSIFTAGVVAGSGLWVLFLGWMIVGASDCWVATAFSYVADTTEPQVRTRYFAFLTVAIGSAFIVGPATSGIFSASGPATPLYVLLALLALAVVWGLFSMPESLPPAQRTASLQVSHLNPLTQIRDILRFPQLRTLLLSYFLFWPSVIVISSNLPTLLADQAAWGPEQISSALVLWGVIVVAVQLVVVPLLLRRFPETHLAVFGGALAAVAFVLFALFPTTGAVPLIYAGVVAFAVAQPFAQICVTGAMSTSMGAEIQGRVAGAVAATMALAQVVGPFAAGWLYEAVSPTAPYWMVAIQVCVATALIVVAIPQLTRLAQRNRQTPALDGPHRSE